MKKAILKRFFHIKHCSQKEVCFRAKLSFRSGSDHRSNQNQQKDLKKQSIGHLF